MNTPVVVLGFGRSGTTWVADMISRATESLVLFEPIHPSVIENCRDFAYSRILPGDAEASNFAVFYRKLLAKNTRKPWLLRNHVSAPLKDVEPAEFEQIWEEGRVIGTKEIRANFLIPLFKDKIGARVVFVARDPRAVVASILKRSNFWEFGWPGTYELLLERTVHHSRFAGTSIAGMGRLASSARTDLERIAVMWAITHAIALRDVEVYDIPFFYYEDLYVDPVTKLADMLAALGLGETEVHSDHLFQPSVTTTRLLHQLYDNENSRSYDQLDFFWNQTLSPLGAARVMEIAGDFGVDIYAQKSVEPVFSLPRTAVA